MTFHIWRTVRYVMPQVWLFLRISVFQSDCYEVDRRFLSCCTSSWIGWLVSPPLNSLRDVGCQFTFSPLCLCVFCVCLIMLPAIRKWCNFLQDFCHWHLRLVERVWILVKSSSTVLTITVWELSFTWEGRWFRLFKMFTIYGDFSVKVNNFLPAAFFKSCWAFCAYSGAGICSGTWRAKLRNVHLSGVSWNSSPKGVKWELCKVEYTAYTHY
jgi:hypothetical protein